MKSLRLFLSALVLTFVIGIVPLATQTGCTTKQTTVTYLTLEAVGKTAKASLDASTQFLKQGAITVAQWQKIANAYDNDFQPAYNLAVVAAGSSSAPAPADLVTKQSAFSASVAQLTLSPAK